MHQSTPWSFRVNVSSGMVMRGGSSSGIISRLSLLAIVGSLYVLMMQSRSWTTLAMNYIPFALTGN